MNNRFSCVLATQNAHKIKEIAPFLDPQFSWLTLAEGGWSGGKLVENESTFKGNAFSKAEQGYLGTGYPTLADDSGLVVPALGGAPVFLVHASRGLMLTTLQIGQNW